MVVNTIAFLPEAPSPKPETPETPAPKAETPDSPLPHLPGGQLQKNKHLFLSFRVKFTAKNRITSAYI